MEMAGAAAAVHTVQHIVLHCVQGLRDAALSVWSPLALAAGLLDERDGLPGMLRPPVLRERWQKVRQNYHLGCAVECWALMQASARLLQRGWLWGCLQMDGGPHVLQGG